VSSSSAISASSETHALHVTESALRDRLIDEAADLDQDVPGGLPLVAPLAKVVYRLTEFVTPEEHEAQHEVSVPVPRCLRFVEIDTGERLCIGRCGIAVPTEQIEDLSPEEVGALPWRPVRFDVWTECFCRGVKGGAIGLPVVERGVVQLQVEPLSPPRCISIRRSSEKLLARRVRLGGRGEFVAPDEQAGEQAMKLRPEQRIVGAVASRRQSLVCLGVPTSYKVQLPERGAELGRRVVVGLQGQRKSHAQVSDCGFESIEPSHRVLVAELRGCLGCKACEPIDEPSLQRNELVLA